MEGSNKRPASQITEAGLFMSNYIEKLKSGTVGAAFSKIIFDYKRQLKDMPQQQELPLAKSFPKGFAQTRYRKDQSQIHF